MCEMRDVRVAQPPSKQAAALAQTAKQSKTPGKICRPPYAYAGLVPFCYEHRRRASACIEPICRDICNSSFLSACHFAFRCFVLMHSHSQHSDGDHVLFWEPCRRQQQEMKVVIPTISPYM